MTQTISIQLTPDELRKIVREEVLTVVEPILQNPSPTDKQPKTRKETAKLLGVSLPTLNQKTKEGKIKAHRFGGKVFYKPEDIEKALKIIRVRP